MAERLFEANLHRAGRREGARLSLRPRARSRGAAAVLARLRGARPLRPARRAGGQGRRRRSDDRGGAAHPRRRNRRALRPLPRPGDVPDPRPRRQGRSPSAAGRWSRARRPSTSIRRRRRSSTRARCCSTTIGRARPRTTRAGSSSVEGYVDAIAMSEAGFPEVVAPLGTALTADQCALLWAMAEEPILCFDGDKRGTQGGLPRDRDGAAADRRGQEPALRASPRGPGPRRSHPRERRAGDGGGAEGGAPVRRHAVSARERRSGRSTRRRARAALSEGSTRPPPRSPTRRCAATTRPT